MIPFRDGHRDTLSVFRWKRRKYRTAISGSYKRSTGKVPPNGAHLKGVSSLLKPVPLIFYPGETANLIDIRSQLSPTDWDIKIGPTRHAYFGVRMIESLRATAGATLVDSAGRSDGASISGEISDWVDCSGQIAAGKSAGVALFRYPSTAEASWYIADWGTLAVNPFAREGRMIRHGEVLDLAVRVVVHDGDAEVAGIEGLYRRFYPRGSEVTKKEK